MRRGPKLAVLAGTLTLAAAATAVAVEASGVGERIPGGVRVDGIEVGGLSPAEATRLLEHHAPEGAKRPVRVEGSLATVVTSGAALGARPRIDEALATVNAGRVGPIRSLLGRGRRRELPLEYDIPLVRVEALSARLGAVPARDVAVVVDGSGVHVTQGRDGWTADVDGLAAELTTLPRRVRVPMTRTLPRVTTAAAEAAAARARRLVDRARTIVIGSDTHTLTRADLLGALSVRRAGHSFTVGFDPIRLGRLLPAPRAARSAEFRVEGDGVRLIPSVTGHTVDVAATALALADPTRTSVTATVSLVRPAMTTADLTALGIRERISTFTTRYPPAQPRVVKIQRASAVIDGTILRPGETYSMNAVLGERTLAKGYVPAPQIVGSSFADSVGGGISQVATMLYNGAFFAGLELIEHQPHSFYIDRYPLGREATISWGGPELIFRNDWPAAVLIDLKASASAVTIQLFSSRLERRVETETLPTHSHGGFTVEYTRRVYRGSRLARDERFHVRYGVAAAPGGR